MKPAAHGRPTHTNDVDSCETMFQSMSVCVTKDVHTHYATDGSTQIVVSGNLKLIRHNEVTSGRRGLCCQKSMVKALQKEVCLSSVQ